MAPQTLYDKLWSSHAVHVEDDGTTLVYIDRHLVHEVTSPQAFDGLKLAGRNVWRPGSIVATADHNTPTRNWDYGIADPTSRLQVETLDANMRGLGVKAYFPFRDGVDQAADAGVKAIVQPGGSVRDDEVIKAADDRGVAMVFTGTRHFRH